MVAGEETMVFLYRLIEIVGDLVKDGTWGLEKKVRIIVR